MMEYNNLTNIKHFNCKEILIMFCNLNIEDKNHAFRLSDNRANVKLLPYKSKGHGNALFKGMYGENF